MSLVRALAAVLLPLALGACEKAARNMYDQAKYRPLAPSSLWADGSSARPLETGVVVHSAGVLAGSSSGREGEQPAPAPAGMVLPLDERGIPVLRPPANAVRPSPAPVTPALLERGRERYDIYCAPCHSVTGDGDGMAVRRGFPQPATLHSEKLRNATDAHLYDVITYGYGVMYPFEDRIAPRDRWALVAYLRALQLSRHARLAELVPADRDAALRTLSGTP
jgi:mono/diheme cytochrome c family protein